MKKALSLLLALVLCLGLCACGNSEGKIKEALTKGEWYSDRESDNGYNRTYNYNIRFYEDGSYKLTYISHTYNWAWQQSPETKTETGTWSIDGKAVTLTSNGAGNVVKLTYSRDNERNKDILTGPQSEGGYTYYRFSGGGIVGGIG